MRRTTKGYSENVLMPVTLSGVIIPWNAELAGGGESDYKLACSSGNEYLIVADSQWKSVLASYCWEDVKIIGLLNSANMTLIPQKVYPKGPTGEKEKVIDILSWKSRESIAKVVKKINDFVVVPAAVWAVMAM